MSALTPSDVWRPRIGYASVSAGGLLACVLTALLFARGSTRVAVIGLAVAVALVALRGRTAPLVAVLVLVAGLALVRRLTGGPGAYVRNDPLVVLPLLLLVPPLLTTRLLRGGWNWVDGVFAAYVGWVLLTALPVLSSAPSTVAYAAVGGVAPAGVAWAVARGEHPRLVQHLLTLAVVLSVPMAVYGLWQYVSPPSWDLAWLRSVRRELNSVGQPEQGKFRLWGTSEAPLPFATVVTTYVFALVATVALEPRRRVWAALGLVGLLPVLFLTGVRSALFAIPLVLFGAVFLVRGRSRLYLVLGLAVAATLVVAGPALVHGSAAVQSKTEAKNRLDVTHLGKDKSYQDRLLLLPAFGPALARPLGEGPGSSGLANRLSGKIAQTNTDNGFLTLALEGGAVRMGAFVVLLVTALGRSLRRARDLTRRGAATATDLLVPMLLLYGSLSMLGGPSTEGAAALPFWVAIGAGLARGSGRP